MLCVLWKGQSGPLCELPRCPGWNGRWVSLCPLAPASWSDPLFQPLWRMASRELVTGKHACEKAGAEYLNIMLDINVGYYIVMLTGFLISAQLPADMGKPLDAFSAWTTTSRSMRVSVTPKFVLWLNKNVAWQPARPHTATSPAPPSSHASFQAEIAH